jgi:hypothetical protein
MEIKCEDCRHKQCLQAPLGAPGHRPGDIVYAICGGCEQVLRIDIPRHGPAAAFVSPWLARQWRQ